MRNISIIAIAVILLSGSGNPVFAQSQADTLRIETAVAQYIKPSLQGKVLLESRLRLPQTGYPAPAERNSASTLATELGVSLGHLEDVFGCATNCSVRDVDQLIAFDRPTINGDSASLIVERVRLVQGEHGKHIVLESQEYLLENTGGKWLVTKLGAWSIS